MGLGARIRSAAGGALARRHEALWRVWRLSAPLSDLTEHSDPRRGAALAAIPDRLLRTGTDGAVLDLHRAGAAVGAVLDSERRRRLDGARSAGRGRLLHHPEGRA